MTIKRGWKNCSILNFYSHIPCGMWLDQLTTINVNLHFYSHIPCGMWLHRVNFFCFYQYFYSHIPCGMWLQTEQQGIYWRKFLLTHPVWDVTIMSSPAYRGEMYDFYSHIPCGMWLSNFSSFRLAMRFLLTHPVWDVTGSKLESIVSYTISTHTSRVGCDPITLKALL